MELSKNLHTKNTSYQLLKITKSSTELGETECNVGNSKTPTLNLRPQPMHAVTTNSVLLLSTNLSKQLGTIITITVNTLQTVNNESEHGLK